MNDRQTFVVDFVARGNNENEWRMVLVEEGPWGDNIEVALLRIQNRLYECIDAILDGQLSDKFPETKGKSIVIELDCFNAPQKDVSEFFERFASGVFDIDSYKRDLERSEFASKISFEIKFQKS